MTPEELQQEISKLTDADFWRIVDAVAAEQEKRCAETLKEAGEVL